LSTNFNADRIQQALERLQQLSAGTLEDVSVLAQQLPRPPSIDLLAIHPQEIVDGITHTVDTAFASFNPSSLTESLTDAMAQLQKQVPSSPEWFQSIASSLPTSVQLSIAAILTFGLVQWLLKQQSSSPPPNRPYPMNRYDAVSARRYFDQRPVQVLARSVEIAWLSTQFALSVFLERGSKEELGRELPRLLTRLGPTFIKVGQSLSIRTDLLSPEYIRGLETLQDQVPAFDTAMAKQIIEEEWGKPITAVLESELTAKPIAAASLGQVYKGKLRATGQDVAIKVQRPDIVEKIALDMHLLREFGGVAKRVFTFINTDLVGTVDVWAQGFVDELDYIQEAANGEFFAEKIMETPLKDVVFTPSIVRDHTTNAVLVTSWVDGQRLDQSSNADVAALCSIAMNTYLTMLLELGVLRKLCVQYTSFAAFPPLT
jgi:ABC1 atypical kinase-like domain